MADSQADPDDDGLKEVVADELGEIDSARVTLFTTADAVTEKLIEDESEGEREIFADDVCEYEAEGV